MWSICYIFQRKKYKLRIFAIVQQKADKSCPERMYVHGYDYTYAAGEHELPIRIVNVTDYGFEFELGLLAVPRIVLNQQEKECHGHSI